MVKFDLRTHRFSAEIDVMGAPKSILGYSSREIVRFVMRPLLDILAEEVAGRCDAAISEHFGKIKLQIPAEIIKEISKSILIEVTDIYGRRFCAHTAEELSEKGFERPPSYPALKGPLNKNINDMLNSFFINEQANKLMHK